MRMPPEVTTARNRATGRPTMRASGRWLPRQVGPEALCPADMGALSSVVPLRPVRRPRRLATSVRGGCRAEGHRAFRRELSGAHAQSHGGPVTRAVEDAVVRSEERGEGNECGVRVDLVGLRSSKTKTH